MNLVQANLCVKLAQYLEEMDKSKWDYSRIVGVESVDLCLRNKNGEEKLVNFNCNSVACALGSCATVFPKNFRSVLDTTIAEAIKDGDIDMLRELPELDLDVEFKVGNSWEGADSVFVADFFGLDEETVDKLFLASDLKEFYGVQNISEVTKTMVASKLYKLVKENGYDVR